MDVRPAGSIPSSCHTPALPGVGLRAPHLEEVLACRPDVAWFEVHPENYMYDPMALAALERVRSHYPLSLHGVALSLGTAGPLDRRHLDRLKTLVDLLDPFLVSEHMAWRYLLNPVERRIPLPGQRESPDTHRVRVVLRCQRPIERRRKDRHPNLSGTHP
jgi:uncharacterized protein